MPLCPPARLTDSEGPPEGVVKGVVKGVGKTTGSDGETGPVPG